MNEEERNQRRIDASVRNLEGRGVVLPRNAHRKAEAARDLHRMAAAPDGSAERYGFLDTTPGSAQAVRDIERNTELIRAMGAQRRASGLRRTAMTTGIGAGGDVFAALPRFYDPLEYWDLSGLPWNMADEGHRHKLHKWLRLYYATHYLVPILVDIFTRFPLVGMELYSPDQKLTDFYEDLFFNQLDYGEFLVQMGREFWTVGECFSLGSFDEDLGIWEREELINPEDVVIENFPLLGSKQLKIVPPEYLKKLAQTKAPAKEYRQLEINFPELIPYLRKNEHIPISDVLLKQVANKLTSWDDHGTPILLRGLRTLIHEEKLLASQDAIAERLYSPLILAKLGATDLGDGQGPWFPSPDELDAFRDDMDMALSSDFRLLVHHFALDVENVFGREQMPRLGDDFDRIERRLMQVFGINPSLISSGANSQPYASSALQAEFMNQMLRTFQNYLKKHFRQRALVVAEAQEHYDYELRGQTRVPLMERVVEYDEEGNKVIVEKHKLLVPELQFAVLDLRDEATERQFLQTLRTMGVPISDQRLMVGVEFDVEDEVDDYNDELVKKTVAQQTAKMKTYKILEDKGLPIPPDLRAEVESALNPMPQPAPGGGLPGMPSGAGGPGGPAGMGSPGGHPGESIVMPPPPGGLFGPQGLGGPVPGGGPPAAGVNGPGFGSVPPVSNERRPGLTYNTKLAEEENPERPSTTRSSSAKVTPDELDNRVSGPRSDEDGKIIERVPKDRKKKYSIIADDD